jgi:glycosyltransferase involved in cell wall biosynthesis
VRILQTGFGFRPYRHGGLIMYAEDLMDVLVARGHSLGYFFVGRQYPLLPRDRVRRWTRRGIPMWEVIGSTIICGGDSGTRTPEADIAHPPSEANFERVLREFRPDLVHMQELIGLPSSLIDIARAHGVPTVITLHDYFLLCPTLKLFDVDDRICLRPDVGGQCARCCAGAPAGRGTFVRASLGHDVATRIPQSWVSPAVKVAGPVLDAVTGAFRRGEMMTGETPAELEPPPAPPEAAARYQERRDTNVKRLNRIDALIAQSRRVQEIYAQLGVDRDRIEVVHSTLRHHESIRPKVIEEPPRPVRFVTLNGCASVQKGSEVILGALDALARDGPEDAFELSVLGYVAESARPRLLEHRNVKLAGYYEPEALDAVLEPFHVGIVPSAWEEVYGYVGIEFLAKGIPVIGNARGGITDYTREGETGWLNRSADGEGLAQIMREVVERPEQIVELNGRIRAERESIVRPFAEHVDDVERVYRSVVAG